MSAAGLLKCSMRRLLLLSDCRGNSCRIISRKVPRGVLRGLHYQLGKPQGNSSASSPDTSGTSPSTSAATPPPSADTPAFTSNRSPDDGELNLLWIPEGCAHGSSSSRKRPKSLQTTDVYHPQGERSILWNDPTLAIEWAPRRPDPTSQPQRRQSHPLRRRRTTVRTSKRNRVLTPDGRHSVGWKLRARLHPRGQHLRHAKLPTPRSGRRPRSGRTCGCLFLQVIQVIRAEDEDQGLCRLWRFRRWRRPGTV